MTRGMFRISHIQIRVRDIRKAVADFRDAGFVVHWNEAVRAPNAFIWFPDGPFVEIMTMHNRLRFLTPVLGIFFGRPMAQRFNKWIDSPVGLCDLAIEPLDPVLRQVDELSGCRRLIDRVPGVRPSRVMTAHRPAESGGRVRFSFMGLLPRGLPFVASAHDIDQRPVNDPPHRNGARSIEELRFVFGEAEWQMLLALVSERPDRVLRVTRPSEMGLGLAGLQEPIQVSGVLFDPFDPDRPDKKH